jgi:WD40 repeat protein
MTLTDSQSDFDTPVSAFLSPLPRPGKGVGLLIRDTDTGAFFSLASPTVSARLDAGHDLASGKPLSVAPGGSLHSAGHLPIFSSVEKDAKKHHTGFAQAAAFLVAAAAHGNHGPPCIAACPVLCAGRACLASGGEDGSLRIWTLDLPLCDSGSPLAVSPATIALTLQKAYQCHSGPIVSVSWSRDAARIASVSRDGTIAVLTAPPLPPSPAFDAPADSATSSRSIAPPPPKERHKSVALRAASQASMPLPFTGTPLSGTSRGTAKSSTHSASSCSGRGQAVQQLQLPAGHMPTCIAFHPTDSNILACGANSGAVFVVSCRVLRVLAAYRPAVPSHSTGDLDASSAPPAPEDPRTVTALAFDDDGAVLATVSARGDCTVHSPSDLVPFRSWAVCSHRGKRSHASSALSIAVAGPLGTETALILSADGRIRQYSLLTGKREGKALIPTEATGSAEPSTRRNDAVAVTFDGSVSANGETVTGGLCACGDRLAVWPVRVADHEAIAFLSMPEALSQQRLVVESPAGPIAGCTQLPFGAGAPVFLALAHAQGQISVVALLL